MSEPLVNHGRRMFLTGTCATVISPLAWWARPIPKRRKQFVMDETKPDATNTGLIAPITSTSSGSLLTISAANQVIENVRYARYISYTGQNVTFRNCDFVGPFNPTLSAGATRALVVCSSASASGLRFENCRFRPQTPHRQISNAVLGHRYTATRCDVSHIVDSFAVAGNDCELAGNYIHDLLYLCPFEFQSDNRTHNDGLQFHLDVRRANIHGNHFRGTIATDVGDWKPPVFNGSTLVSGYRWYPNMYALSCILNGFVGRVFEDITIRKNWINGAESGLNFGVLVPTGLTGFRRIDSNRWGRDFRQGQAAYLDLNSNIQSLFTRINNVYEDDSTFANGWI